MFQLRAAGAFVALVCSVSMTAALAEAQTSACVSKQIGAAGAACAGALKCYGVAAKQDATVEVDCLAGVQAKLSKKLTKLDELVCIVTGVDAQVWDTIDGFALATSLDELAYSTGGACASKKLTAAAKECKALFKCSSVAAKGGQAADTMCLDAAGTKLSEAFTKAEAKLTCTPSGNAGDVDALVGDVHDEIVDLFRNGPTTTTTLPGNQPPSIDSVSLTPSPAYEASTLTCTPVGASDPDLDTVLFTYSWTVSASPIVETGNTLAGDRFSKGDSVTCTAIPSDGIVSGAPVTSNPVTISNSPPLATAAPSISPSTPHTGDNLLCVTPPSEDADGDVVSWSYEWFIDSSPVAATSSTLPNSFTSRDQLVECRVTPNDGTASGAAQISAAVTIQNTAPTGVSINLLPDFPMSSQSLSVSIIAPSTDVDNDVVSYLYYWQINGSPVAPYPSSSSSLDRSNFDKGDSVTCTVVPTDGTLVGASDDDSVLVRNSAPSVTGATVTPPTPTISSTLTCSAVGYSDYDGDVAQNKYQWWRDGVPVPSGAGGQNATLPGIHSSGQTFYCVLTADDGDPLQDGNTVTSNLVTIQ